jgi:hypothetical protein
MNVILGLIYTFFYKKRLQFSKSEMSGLTVLLIHYTKIFKKLLER